MTFAVKTIYCTNADGSPYEGDLDEDLMPTTYHGPFDDLSQAISWMENDYPDDDTDVYEQYAADYDIPDDWLNDPASIFGDIPDEDIRPEVDEPPC